MSSSGSSRRRWSAEDRGQAKVAELFARVRAFCAARFPGLASTSFRWCGLGMGGRQFMHTGHRRHRAGPYVCIAPAAPRLSRQHLVGLVLHEFGHVATRGDDQAADLWVFRCFGIPVLYRGPQGLEWVSERDIRRAGI